MAVTEPRIIRGNEVVMRRETRQQRLVHPRGRRKAMEEQQRRPIRPSGLAIEDGQAIDHYTAIERPLGTSPSNVGQRREHCTVRIFGYERCERARSIEPEGRPLAPCLTPATSTLSRRWA